MVEYFRGTWGEDWAWTDEVATFTLNMEAMPRSFLVDTNEEVVEYEHMHAML